MLRLIFLFSCLFSLAAQKESFLFDAFYSSWDDQEKIHLFEGEVLVMGPDLMISCDKLIYEVKSHKLKAIGHVFLVKPEGVFWGEEISYGGMEDTFEISHGAIILDEKHELKDFLSKLWGFSRDLEKERQKLLDQLKEKIFYQDGDLTLLEEQKKILEQQPDPQLSSLKGRKKRLEIQRRKVWESFYDESFPSYLKGSLRLEGEKIFKLEEDRWEGYKVCFTGCRTFGQEKPAWALSSRKIEGQKEGYIDFWDPVFEVKGIPVFYLPYLKAPWKTQRQWGLLLPEINYDSMGGLSYVQPIFLNAGNSFDGTLGLGYSKTAGPKLSALVRSQPYNYSGWNWIGNFAKNDHSSISLKGDMSWDALKILTPHLSWVSQGRWWLTPPRDTETLIPWTVQTGGKVHRAFDQAGWQMHYDHPNVYWGVGSRLAQIFPLGKEEGETQKIPLSAQWASRWYGLKDWVYVQTGMEDKVISKNQKWHQIHSDLLVPLSSSQNPMEIHFLTQMEGRALENPEQSFIFSPLSRMTIQLPSQGLGGFDQKQIWEHRMTHGLIYSLRPWVLRRGITEDVFPTDSSKKWGFEDNFQDFFMEPHEKIIFHTHHLWMNWNFDETKQKKVEASSINLRDYRVGRKSLELESQISYDFKNSLHPWSLIESTGNLKWGKGNLVMKSSFSMEFRDFSHLKLEVKFPEIFHWKFFGGMDWNQPDLTNSGEDKYQRNNLYYGGAQVLLSPGYELFWQYGHKKFFQGPPLQGAQIKARYGSPQGCWGYEISWQKDFDSLSWIGLYALGINIQFLGNEQNASTSSTLDILRK